VRVRPLRPADLGSAVEVFFEAFGLGPDASRADYIRARFAHLLGGDPAGAFAAVDDDARVLGVAMATRRGGLWTLSQLAVAPAAQSHGAGGALLRAALTYARADDARLIIASDDPRARRLYARAGLRPRPTLEARGPVDRARLAPVTGVRGGGPRSLELCDEVDRVARGYERRADLEFMVVAAGRNLWLIDDARGRGYAITAGDRLHALGATSAPVAADLLRHALANAGEAYVVSFTGEQQTWAHAVLREAGLEPATRGAIFTSPQVQAWDLFIPNPALG
jgi:ribosomal protein S18 acetylase RimI-like enzyme